MSVINYYKPFVEDCFQEERQLKMRRTGQTFRLLLKALLLASEEKQDIIIVVNKEDYGSSLIRKLYRVIKDNLGDFAEKNIIIRTHSSMVLQ